MNELCSLRELGIEFIDGDRGTNYPQSNEFMEDGYCLFLGAHNITDAGFSFEKTQFISEDKDSILRNGKLQRGDIVLMTRGTWGKGGAVGNVALYDESVPYDNIRINSVMLIIRCNKNYSAELLYYLFHSSLIRNQIDKIVTGSVQNQLTAAVVSELKVPRNPNISVQILQAIDKKISINTKQISALESMAKTLYDYWFVQFDFPDANGRPYKTSGGKMEWNEELGRKIPAGWEVIQLKDFAEVTQGNSPSGNTLNEEKKGIAFYQGKTDFGMRFPIERIYTTEPYRYAEDMDTILSVRAPVGAVNMAEKKCCIGRGLAAIHNEKYQSLVYYMMMRLQPVFEKRGSGGTTFDSITKDDIKEVFICRPPQMLCDEFEEKARTIDMQILNITQENRKLTVIRDFLLPMLMNGQVTFRP